MLPFKNGQRYPDTLRAAKNFSLKREGYLWVPASGRYAVYTSFMLVFCTRTAINDQSADGTFMVALRVAFQKRPTVSRYIENCKIFLIEARGMFGGDFDLGGGGQEFRTIHDNLPDNSGKSS